MAQVLPKASVLADNSSDSSDDGITRFEVKIHSLTAKVFLNCELEDLVPEEYAVMAERSPVTERSAWIFRKQNHHYDGRRANLKKWSGSDRRYKNLFIELSKAPDFKKGLYEGGSSFHVDAAMESKYPIAQAEALKEFLKEVNCIMNCKYKVHDGNAFYFLDTKLMAWCPEYVTGYPVRHSDAPPAVGCIFLNYFPSGFRPKHMIPLTVTLESESLESAVAGKIKLMLAELYMHLHRSGAYADKLPHQETYLFGMHGSRFHVFRAWFPGQKCSAIWCGKKELPVWRKVLPKKPSSKTADPAEIKRYDEAVQQAMNEYLSELGGEPDMRTFRVVASREFDLWKKSDFREAVKTAVAIFSYFMSGHARMGTLTDAFQYPPEYENLDNNNNKNFDKDQEVLMKQETTTQKENEAQQKTAQPQSDKPQDNFQRPTLTDNHHPYPRHHSLYLNHAAAQSGILHGIDPLSNDKGLNHYLESRWVADIVDDDSEEDEGHGHGHGDDDGMMMMMDDDSSEDNEYAK